MTVMGEGVPGGLSDSSASVDAADAAMQSAVRKERITKQQRDDSIADLASLPISADDETMSRAWSTTVGLADRYGLTTYDAAYLELALRRRLPLATLDQQLANAARSAGVAVLP